MSTSRASTTRAADVFRLRGTRWGQVSWQFQLHSGLDGGLPVNSTPTGRPKNLLGWKALPLPAVLLGVMLFATTGCEQSGTTVATGPETNVSVVAPALPSPEPAESGLANPVSPAPTSSPPQPQTPRPVSVSPTRPPVESTTAPASPPSKPPVTVSGRTELVAALNTQRQAAGAPTVTFSNQLAESAEACARKVLAAGNTSVCDEEVITIGSPNPKPEDLVAAWFANPQHKAALTREESTKAGGAIVSDGTTAVSVLAVDK